jgi:hypothetical protein
VKRSGCVGFVLAALARAAVFPTTTCIAAEHPPTGAPQSHPPRQTCFGNWRVFAWRSSASSLGTATRESIPLTLTERTCRRSTTFEATNRHQTGRPTVGGSPSAGTSGGDEHTACDHRCRRLRLRQSDQDNRSRGMGAVMVTGRKQARDGSWFEDRCATEPLRDEHRWIARATDHRGGPRGAVIRTDGSGLTKLLGGMEANFPGWRPQR